MIQTMEYENKLFRILESGLLSFSSILQFICLVTPGWYTYIRNDLEHYSGIFYRTECKRDKVHEEMKCETNSYLDVLKNAKDDYITEDSAKITYHHQVRVQLILLLVLALTIACLVLQYCKHKRKNISFILMMTAVTMTSLGFSGALMISHLSGYYIMISYQLAPSEQRETDWGFPYCVLLYTMAFITTGVTLILDIIEIRKVLREHFGPMQSTGSEGVVMSLLDNDESAPKPTGGQVSS